MVLIPLTEGPVIKGIEAVKDQADGSKFLLRIRERAYVGSLPVEVTWEVPNLDFATWDGTYWASPGFATARDEAWQDWNYEQP